MGGGERGCSAAQHQGKAQLLSAHLCTKKIMWNRSEIQITSSRHSRWAKECVVIPLKQFWNSNCRIQAQQVSQGLCCNSNSLVLWVTTNSNPGCTQPPTRTLASFLHCHNQCFSCHQLPGRVSKPLQLLQGRSFLFYLNSMFSCDYFHTDTEDWILTNTKALSTELRGQK